MIGTVPILLHSFQDPLFEDLPVLFVHEWEEINPVLLKQKYEELKPFRTEKAYADYWIRQILEVKEKVQKQDLSFTEKTLFSPLDLEDLHSLVGEALVYRGLLTSDRPKQLGATVYLYDPWAEGSLSEEEFTEKVQLGCPVFLDFTYFRSSLFRKGPYTNHNK